MTDCTEPVLVPDPDAATRTEINVERVEVAKYAVCYRTKFHGLRDWIKGMQSR